MKIISLMRYLLLTCLFAGIAAITYANPPNIIIIMADDQGIGDIGFNQNPLIQTPALDRLAGESTHFTQFYVSPVCAPTRASLMTGMYTGRTGVYDTYNGGAIMAAEEITIAEELKRNHYATGIFGKWHLGDNYPFRPVDQGFMEALVHKSGGIGQPGDVDNYFAADSAYFDPVLYHNGKRIKTKGYCSDVFTGAAIEFIRENRETPFFLYLAFNAPHTPLQLPEKYYRMYSDLNLEDILKHSGDPDMQLDDRDLEDAKRVYGMVSNIDDNIDRLLTELRKLELIDETVIIYLSDNGPQQNRYRMGLRGKKGLVYEGGIRVPCLIRYPTVFNKAEQISTPLAHIDLFPTIIDLCGLTETFLGKTDGISLLPLLSGNNTDFHERPLFWEWGRGFPVKYRNMAIRKGNYKLVGNCGHTAPIVEFELFDLKTDPLESNNLIHKEKDIAEILKSLYDEWFDEMVRDPANLEVQRVHIGSEYENPVLLNRNDAKGTGGIWSQADQPFHWDVSFVEDAGYDMEACFLEEITVPGKLILQLYPHHYIRDNNSETNKLNMENIRINRGNYMLVTFYRTEKGENIFPLCVSVEKQK